MAGTRAKKAADEIRALWAFLDRRAKQISAVGNAPARRALGSMVSCEPAPYPRSATP